MAKRKWVDFSIEAALFVLASLGAFYLVYSIANTVGSLLPPTDPLQHLGTVAPVAGLCILSIYALFAFHAYRHCLGARPAHRTLMANGLVGLGLTFAVLIYLFARLCTGALAPFVGYPTAFYPIDCIVYLLIEEFAFLAMYLYGLWLRKHPERFVPVLTGKRRVHGLFAVFQGAGALIALYLFGAFLFGFSFMGSRSHGFVLSATLLFILLPAGVYVTGETLLTAGTGRKGRLYALIALSAALLAIVFVYYVARMLDPRGYVEVSSPYLAVDYMLSLGLTPLCVIVSCLAALADSWVRWLLPLVKEKKEKREAK